MSQAAVIVTGASGFVGSRVASHLVAAGNTVIAPMRDPSRAPAGTVGIEWNLESGGLDKATLSEVAAIVHTAALIPTDYSDPAFAEACFHTNALGSLKLVHEAITVGVDAVIQLSTGNLYQNHSRPALEDDPIYPGSSAPYYLTSKLAQEVFTTASAKCSTLRLVTLRPSAIYGPGMTSTGLVPVFAARLLAGEPIEVSDGGNYGVDLVFIDDVVSATLASLEREVSGTFNVGSGIRSTTLEVATCLATECEGDYSLIHIAHPSSDAGAGYSALDITRAKDELGLTPTTLTAGLRRYVRHLREYS